MSECAFVTLGRVAGRAIAVSLDRAPAVIEKPRTFYVPANGGSLGSPVFFLNCKIAEIMLSQRFRYAPAPTPPAPAAKPGAPAAPPKPAK